MQYFAITSFNLLPLALSHSQYTCTCTHVRTLGLNIFSSLLMDIPTDSPTGSGSLFLSSLSTTGSNGISSTPALLDLKKKEKVLPYI